MTSQDKDRLTETLLRQQGQLMTRLQEATLDVFGQVGFIPLRDLQFQTTDGDLSPTRIQPPWYQQSQKRGEVLPVYQTELQLQFIRDRSRILAHYNEFALCGIENRANYVVGDGLRYKAVGTSDNPDKSLLRDVQDVIDATSEANDIPGMEREAMTRLDVDGDAIIRLFRQDGGTIKLRFVEPEHLRAPHGSDWPAETSFGVQTKKGDICTVEGYWIVDDPIADAWTPHMVPARDIVHLKLNTPSTAKRGLPTFFPVEANLRRCEDLLASMSSLVKARAKIALIRKLAGVASSTAEALLNRLTDIKVTDPAAGDELNIERLRYGSVLTIPANTDYQMPTLQFGCSDVVEALQAELRAVASRVQMPEWMFTALADAKYSNAFVVEAPTLKGFRHLQRLFVRHFGEHRYGPSPSLMWRVIRYAVECQILPREVLRDVKITAEPTSLETRDKGQESQVNKTYVDMGVKSKRQVQMEQNLDPEEQAKWIAEEREKDDARQMEQMKQQAAMKQPPEGEPQNVRESTDAAGHDHGERGRFTPKGSGEHHAGLASKVAQLVKRPIHAVKRLAAAAMDKVRSRYGNGVAKAVKTAILIGQPIPLPAASLLLVAPIIAFAEMRRQLRGVKESKDASGHEHGSDGKFSSTVDTGRAIARNHRSELRSAMKAERKGSLLVSHVTSLIDGQHETAVKREKKNLATAFRRRQATVEKMFGPSTLLTPEWQAVHQAHKDAHDETISHLQSMTDAAHDGDAAALDEATGKHIDAHYAHHAKIQDALIKFELAHGKKRESLEYQPVFYRLVESVDAATWILREAFTGTVVDSLGRVYHYVNGKRVKSTHEQALGAEATKADRDAHAEKARASKAAAQGVVGKLSRGEALTDDELHALPGHLAWHSGAELKALHGALGGGGKPKLKEDLVNALAKKFPPPAGIALQPAKQEDTIPPSPDNAKGGTMKNRPAEQPKAEPPADKSPGQAAGEAMKRGDVEGVVSALKGVPLAELPKAMEEAGIGGHWTLKSKTALLDHARKTAEHNTPEKIAKRETENKQASAVSKARNLILNGAAHNAGRMGPPVEHAAEAMQRYGLNYQEYIARYNAGNDRQFHDLGQELYRDQIGKALKELDPNHPTTADVLKTAREAGYGPAEPPAEPPADPLAAYEETFTAHQSAGGSEADAHAKGMTAAGFKDDVDLAAARAKAGKFASRKPGIMHSVSSPPVPPELQSDRGTPKPSPAPVKPSAGPVTDATKLTPDNLRGAWEHYRDELANHDPKLSPNRAGELAAVRVRKAIRQRMNEIDDKARTGKITPEEGTWYDRQAVDGWNPGRELENMSGGRTMIADEDHPHTDRPLGAEPLPDNRRKVAEPKVEEKPSHAAEYMDANDQRRHYRIVEHTNSRGDKRYYYAYDLGEGRKHSPASYTTLHATREGAEKDLAEHLDYLVRAHGEENVTVHDPAVKSHVDAMKKVRDDAKAAEQAKEDAKRAEAERKYKANTEGKIRVEAHVKTVKGTKGKVTVQTNAGPVEREATHYGPFAVSKSEDGSYDVTHTASGLNAAGLQSQANARTIAAVMGSKGNWTAVKPDDDTMRHGIAVKKAVNDRDYEAIAAMLPEQPAEASPVKGSADTLNAHLEATKDPNHTVDIDAAVAEMGKHSKERLAAILKQTGQFSFPAGESKAKLLARVRDRLNATRRVRDEVSV